MIKASNTIIIFCIYINTNYFTDYGLMKKIPSVKSLATGNSESISSSLLLLLLSSLSTNVKMVMILMMVINIVFSLYPGATGTAASLSLSSSITTSMMMMTTMIIPAAYAQPDLQTIKSRNLVMDLGNGVKTNAQLTLPVVGKGPYPGVLLIQGSGALDMNETQGIIHVDKKTGTKKYPPTPFFQIAKYLSERGFAVLRYDKRGIGANVTILDSNIWGNVTLDNLKNDAERALNILAQQPEVDKNAKISLIGHSEGAVIAPRVAVDNYNKIKNIVLMGAEAGNLGDSIHFQNVGLPLLYAQKVLDKNHTLLLPIEQASKDPIFQHYVSNANVSDANNDTYISINNELRPAVVTNFETFVDDVSSPSSSQEKCNDPEGCALLLRSYILSNNTLSILEDIPSNIGILVLQGENDTFTPVQQAFLIQQKLTEIKHSDHTLITYPNLGHYFYPTSQWIETVGPIQEHVLADLFAWLSSHTAA